nr:hypothetical protein [Tanacetum cinerariifolium]
MACSVSHTVKEIKAMIQKQIDKGNKILSKKSNRFKHDLPFKPRWGNDPGKLCATPDLLIRNCSCSKGSVEDKILVPKPPKSYARCGHPFNGPYCQGCTLLREKLEEDLDHDVNPPHIDECCCECGEALDGISCQQCACKSCGKGAHIGYNYLSKVPIISNPEPCNQTINTEPPQTLPSFDSTCYSDKENSVPYVSKPNFVDESSNIFNPPPQPPIYSCEFCGSNAQYGHYCAPQAPFINPKPSFDQTQPPQFPVIHPPPQETSIEISHDQENVINSVQTFLRKFNRYFFFETPKVLLLAWDRVSEIKDAFENKQYKSEDIQELFRKLLDDLKNIHEELAEFINSPGWNRPAEPDNSLSMGDENLDTIPAMESDDVIKSSVANLVPIPSEFKGIPDIMCDVHLVNNPTPLEAKDHFEIDINSNDDYSSSDDDSLYYENLKYVEASPHDSEFVSLEVEKIVISKDEEIEDNNLREKLLKVDLLIAKIEALKDNPTPSFKFLAKSSSTSPTPFLEGTNTFHNSLPEFKNFCFDLEEISSGSTTTHSVISLREYGAFSFYDDHIEEISSGSTTTQ